MFFTRDAYVVCTLVVLAGEVCVSLVSEAAVLCVSFPGHQELLLKCSPRPVLLLLCLMGCWRAEAELAQTLPKLLEAGQAIPHQTQHGSRPCWTVCSGALP